MQREPKVVVKAMAVTPQQSPETSSDGGRFCS